MILAEGEFGQHSAKTAYGVIRYGRHDVVAVIDSTRAGQNVSAFLPGHDIPIVVSQADKKRGRGGALVPSPVKAAAVYVEASPSFKGKEKLMEKVLANYVARTYKGQSEIGAMDPQRLSTVQKFYLKEGFITSELPLDQLDTNAFIK